MDLLVVRVGNGGNLLMSMPCAACVRLLIKYSKLVNICHIYYSDDEGNIVKTNLFELAQNENVRVSHAYEMLHQKPPFNLNNRCKVALS